MATTEVGRIIFAIEARSQQFQRETAKAGQTTLNLANTTWRAATAGRAFTDAQMKAALSADQLARAQSRASAASRGMGMSTGRTTAAVFALGSGIEDATAVFGTTGFAGALRAAGNNISQFGFLVGGMTGAILGISASIGGSLLANFLSMKKKTDEATDSLGAYRRELERVEKASRFTRSLAEQDLPGAQRSVKDADDDVGTFREVLADIEARSNRIPKEMEAAKKRIKELNQLLVDNIDTGAEFSAAMGEGAGEEYRKALSAERAELTKSVELDKERLKVIRERQAVVSEDLAMAEKEFELAKKRAAELQKEEDSRSAIERLSIAARDRIAANEAEADRIKLGRVESGLDTVGARRAEIEEAIKAIEERQTPVLGAVGAIQRGSSEEFSARQSQVRAAVNDESKRRESREKEQLKTLKEQASKLDRAVNELERLREKLGGEGVAVFDLEGTGLDDLDI